MDPGQFARRADHVVWKEVEGKALLINLRDGAYFEVNPAGLAVWERCDGRTTVAEIVRRIGKEFRADPARVSRDVAEFLRELRRRKIVELSSKPAPASARVS